MPLRRKVNRLREVRKAKGFSAYDLQLLSHVPAQIIYCIERGLQRARPSEKRMLAEALQVSEKDLFPAHLERNQEIEGLPFRRESEGAR
jgi:transcriptional regulator with XRE-family HTH domain